MNKPIHVKPALYAQYYLHLKEIALKYGYNLVVHGSLSRDLDLIAIAWNEELKPYFSMIEEFAEYIGGRIMEESDEDKQNFINTFHRDNYIINIHRWKDVNYEGEDPQYYLDISVVSPEIFKK